MGSLPDVKHLTYTNAVIPESNVILLPLEANMELLGSRDDLAEIANNRIALSLGNSNYRFDETWIEEERLPARHGMCTDNGMLCDDCLTTHWTSECTRSFCLKLGRMQCSKTFEICLHLG